MNHWYSLLGIYFGVLFIINDLSDLSERWNRWVPCGFIPLYSSVSTAYFAVLLLCLKIIKPSRSKRYIIYAKDKMNMVKIMKYEYSTYSYWQLLTVYNICMPAASCVYQDYLRVGVLIWFTKVLIFFWLINRNDTCSNQHA